MTFDGAPALRTRANGAVIGVANVDAMEEIQVLTADYAAEYGRAAGGQIRMISKSGTRDFHGSLYEYFRNSDMNANTWTRNLSTLTNFTQPVPLQQFRRHRRRPGLGSRAERQSSARSFSSSSAKTGSATAIRTTPTQAVPTTLMRQGNFSELLGPNPWYSGSHVIYDPTTCPSVGR